MTAAVAAIAREIAHRPGVTLELECFDAACRTVSTRSSTSAGRRRRQPSTAEDFAAMHPEVRLLDGASLQIRQAVGTSVDRRPKPQRFLRDLVKQLKAWGFVANSLSLAGATSAAVAPRPSRELVHSAAAAVPPSTGGGPALADLAGSRPLSQRGLDTRRGTSPPPSGRETPMQPTPRRSLRCRARRLRSQAERGMTTAEYAVGTLAACSFAAVLLAVVRSGGVRSALASVITTALGIGG